MNRARPGRVLIRFLLEEDWVAWAVCGETDPEAFFPEKGGTTRPAKRICGGCPVRVECLQYALDNDESFGVWGGLSAKERAALRRADTHQGAAA